MLHRVQHYNILEELGKGGMGVVYKAEDTRLQRTLALKLLSRDSSGDPKARDRFLREARLASSLQHQNICTIHEIGETSEGELFISMDYYEGDTLQQIISRGTLSLDQVLNYAIQLAKGLSIAHENEIIHRDIKPGNIIITREGIVKILDFGLAKLAGNFDSTQTGKALGTISYLSPEQAQGQKVDHLTDIWSLGVVLYEMATGILPFFHEYEAAVIYSILDKSPLPPSEIRTELPEELEHLIYSCLRKNKEERIQSASELLKALEQIRDQTEGKTHHGHTVSKPGKKDAERRFATIQISEITGFGDLRKNLDEENLHEVLNECLGIFSSIARKYRGILSTRNEDSYMIVFGVTESVEKAPAQAIHASMELQSKIQQLTISELPELHLKLKSGIDSGMVITRSIQFNDRQEFSVSGDTVNFAGSLKDLATDGQILAGSATYKSTKRLFDFESRKIPAGDDGTDQFNAYLLSSGKTNQSIPREGTEWIIRSRMVGREKEFDTLSYHLMKLIHGEGFIVNVIGEAGMGKSRLMAELLKKPEINRVMVLEGRAISSGLNLSFFPIIDIIRSLANIHDADTEFESYLKLEKTVQSFCPDSAEEVFPFIATLMGMTLSGIYAKMLTGIEGEGLEKLILKNLRSLLTGAASQKSLVFISEDLHWADQSSIGLLKSIYRLAENHPILFINVLRPEYHQTGERIRDAIKDRYEKYHTEILLSPLDEDQSELLIRGLLKEKALPDKISSLIKKRVEGNPFFIEEVIRSMIDDGVIFMEENRIRTKENIDSVVIPTTIHEVLMSRIDKLEEETRSLVKLAAVIGRQFFYRVLVEVAGERDDTDHILEYLQKIQLIRKRRRLDEVEYLFKHALIQQAAYETILSDQRKELHLKVARAIEFVFRDRLHEFYGVLAYHCSHGGELEKTENYLIKAGERALKSSASMEALHYYREALAIYLEKYGESADPGKVAMLNKYIALAYFNTGHLIEADVFLEKVLAFHDMKIPTNSLVKLYRVITGILFFLFRLRFTSFMGKKTPSDEEIEINELIRKKASALLITDLKKFLIEMMIYAPWITNFRFRNPNTLVMTGGIFSMGGISMSIANRILDYYIENSDQDDVKAKLTASFGKIANNLLEGIYHDTPLDEEMVHKGLLIGELYSLFNYVAFKAHEQLELGNRQAEQTIDKLLEMTEEYDSELCRLAYYSHGSMCLLKFRDLDKALARADEGIEFVSNSLGNKPGLLMIYSMKIRAQILLGDLSGAEETLKVATDFTTKDRQAPYFLSFYLTASFLFDTSRYEEALNSGEKESLPGLRKKMFITGKKALAVSNKAMYEKVETLRLMGTAHWLTGKQGKAIKWWARSMEKAEAMGARLELSMTLQESAKRLNEPESRYKELKGIKSELLQQEAEQMFSEMQIIPR